MAIVDFLSQVKNVVSIHGYKTGSRISAEKVVERFLTQVGSRMNYGFRPLDHDWDVMILLDACRADLFEEFAPQHSLYDQFDTVSSKYSCASTSREWFDKGFGDVSIEERSDVHYVSENPFLSRLELTEFYQVERLWELRAKTGSGTLDPSVVTDQALNVYQNSTAGRFVVHYIPPHAPFFHCVDKYSLAETAWGGESHAVWYGLQTGEFDQDEVWEDYGQNLLTVLDEVERLVEHVSGSVVITADHANAMGEFGVYGHPGYVPVPALKQVPWVRLAGNEVPYEINDLQAAEPEPDDSSESVEKRLEALGYK